MYKLNRTGPLILNFIEKSLSSRYKHKNKFRVSVVFLTFTDRHVFVTVDL